jgi:nucleoside-diphosphate-sugar epimerase
VESGVDVPYFTTRLAAEQALRQLPDSVSWLCLRPSVIYGEDGASARMFRKLAKLPIQVLPMGGVQTLQPVHIADICDGIVQWLNDTHAHSMIVAAVGAEATTMRGMLDSYREQMQRRAAWHIALPKPVVKLMARLGDWIPDAPLCSDTYAMLAAGNTADIHAFATLLGRAPRSFRQFIS